jgi:hypothetical protein
MRLGEIWMGAGKTPRFTSRLKVVRESEVLWMTVGGGSAWAGLRLAIGCSVEGFDTTFNGAGGWRSNRPTTGASAAVGVLVGALVWHNDVHCGGTIKSSWVPMKFNT